MAVAPQVDELRVFRIRSIVQGNRELPNLRVNMGRIKLPTTTKGAKQLVNGVGIEKRFKIASLVAVVSLIVIKHRLDDQTAEAYRLFLGLRREISLIDHAREQDPGHVRIHHPKTG